MSQNEDQKNSKDFLIGTLIGGIVGASLALLWAPKTGKELRHNLNEQAHNAKEKGEKLAGTAKVKTTNMFEKVRNASSPVQDDLETKIEEQVEVIEESIKEVAATRATHSKPTSEEIEEMIKS